jgi:hypothetical protein
MLHQKGAVGGGGSRESTVNAGINTVELIEFISLEDNFLKN